MTKRREVADVSDVVRDVYIVSRWVAAGRYVYLGGCHNVLGYV